MQIRDAIYSGELRVGDRLPSERELCTMFGVSRPTLREALRTLEVLGIVSIQPGRSGGIFVTAPTAEGAGAALEALIRFRDATARELLEFRVSFEGETAHWAAQRREPAEAEHLERLAAEVVAAADRGDVDWADIVATDLEFHETVARASKNQVRVAILLGISRALYRAVLDIASIAEHDLRRTVGEHLTGIAAAISAGDANEARSRMRSHVQALGELEVRMQERSKSER